MSSSELTNPYLAARQEWNERYGSYVKAASSWRMVALVSLTMAVIGFGYALYQSTQVKLVPYLVEVDKLGTTVMGGFPAQIEYADERVVRSMLSGWVSHFRSVTPDVAVQKGSIDKLYALLQRSDPSTEKINNWYRNHSPFERAREMTVSVEVSNVVAISNQSYQIDWSETERDRSGKERQTKRYRGIATLSLSPPQDEAVIRNNPIGLYIKDFDWSAQLS